MAESVDTPGYPVSLEVIDGPMDGLCYVGRDTDVFTGRVNRTRSKRDPDQVLTNNLVLRRDSLCSGAHARVFYRNSRWMIEDLASTNGTWIRKTKLDVTTEALDLADEDFFIMAQTVVHFRARARNVLDGNTRGKLRISERTKQVLGKASSLAAVKGQPFIGVEELFTALAHEAPPDFTEFCQEVDLAAEEIAKKCKDFRRWTGDRAWIEERLGIHAQYAPPAPPPSAAEKFQTPRLNHVLRLADQARANTGYKRVEPIHLMIAILQEAMNVPARVIETTYSRDCEMLAADAFDYAGRKRRSSTTDAARRAAAIPADPSMLDAKTEFGPMPGGASAPEDTQPDERAADAAGRDDDDDPEMTAGQEALARPGDPANDETEAGEADLPSAEAAPPATAPTEESGPESPDDQAAVKTADRARAETGAETSAETSAEQAAASAAPPESPAGPGIPLAPPPSQTRPAEPAPHSKPHPLVGDMAVWYKAVPIAEKLIRTHVELHLAEPKDRMEVLKSTLVKEFLLLQTDERRAVMEQLRRLFPVLIGSEDVPVTETTLDDQPEIVTTSSTI